MKKIKLLGRALVPLIAQTACVMASDEIDEFEKLSLNAEELYTKQQNSDIIEIKWEVSDKGICLEQLLANEPKDGDTYITLTIPGEIDGKPVSIKECAFQTESREFIDNRLQMKLIFEEVNGKKVKFPQNCNNLFKNNQWLREIDFKGADTSSTRTIEEMFASCRSITELDLSPLDLSKVTTQHTVGMITTSGIKTINIAPLNAIIPEADPFLLYKMTKSRLKLEIDFKNASKEQINSIIEDKVKVICWTGLQPESETKAERQVVKSMDTTNTRSPNTRERHNELNQTVLRATQVQKAAKIEQTDKNSKKVAKKAVTNDDMIQAKQQEKNRDKNQKWYIKAWNKFMMLKTTILSWLRG